MNFLDAKAIISPGSPVVPGSQVHQDILKLMRQSGRVFAEDNVPTVPIPLMAPMVGNERKYVNNERKVSKKEFQSISANVLKEVVVLRKSVLPTFAPTPGMSKKQWLNKISSLNIENGSDERRAEVQADGEVEGGTRPSEGST
tara:strand:- start:935 stop:1363 length:429 start_codon:yes stop_codon:yes gene_type:complete